MSLFSQNPRGILSEMERCAKTAAISRFYFRKTLHLRRYAGFWVRLWIQWIFASWYYLLKVNNKNTTTRCDIFSKLTIKTPERCHWRCSDVFVVNLTYFTPGCSVFIINFEHVIASWVKSDLMLGWRNE